MSSEWVPFYLLVFCIFAYACTLPWSVKAQLRRDNKMRGRVYAGLQIALLFILIGNAINSYVRHERNFRIESEQKDQKVLVSAVQGRSQALKVRLGLLQSKMEALSVETNAAKGSEDKDLLKSLEARREALQAEQKTLTNEAADLQRTILAISKTNDDIQKEINANK